MTAVSFNNIELTKLYEKKEQLMEEHAALYKLLEDDE